jgi:hypothetical protein
MVQVPAPTVAHTRVVKVVIVIILLLLYYVLFYSFVNNSLLKHTDCVCRLISEVNLSCHVRSSRLAVSVSCIT